MYSPPSQPIASSTLSVLLNLHDPASTTYGSVTLAESEAAASIFLDRFERVWEKGVPFDVVLPGAKRVVVDVTSKMREAGFTRGQVLACKTLATLGAVGRSTLAAEHPSPSITHTK